MIQGDAKRNRDISAKRRRIRRFSYRQFDVDAG
jgi:hypothetical protein